MYLKGGGLALKPLQYRFASYGPATPSRKAPRPKTEMYRLAFRTLYIYRYVSTRTFIGIAISALNRLPRYIRVHTTQL